MNKFEPCYYLKEVKIEKWGVMETVTQTSTPQGRVGEAAVLRQFKLTAGRVEIGELGECRTKERFDALLQESQKGSSPYIFTREFEIAYGTLGVGGKDCKEVLNWSSNYIMSIKGDSVGDGSFVRGEGMSSVSIEQFADEPQGRAGMPS